MAVFEHEVMNDLFLDKAYESDASLKKLAESLQGPLRTHIREGCLMNQVWEMVTAPESKIQRDLNDPSQVYVFDELEPDWVAMEMTADGMPSGHFYSGEACGTYFYPIRSKEEIITKDRVRRLNYDIETYFKKHIGNEIARQRDIRFRAQLDAAVALSLQAVGITSTLPQPKDMMAAIDLVDANTDAEVFCTDLIMHYSFVNKIMQNGPAVFDSGAMEFFREGFKSGIIYGRRIHLTRKREFPTNAMYAVAEKDYVATNYEDYPLIFEAKKDLDEIKMKAKCSQGSLIYNVYGISKLTWTEA